MSSSRNLRFTVESECDLREILQYSSETWSEKQSRAYGAKLLDASNHLAGFPNLGRARDDIAPGIRIHQVGEHIILFTVSDNEVVIIRLLHRRMDIHAQFGS